MNLATLTLAELAALTIDQLAALGTIAGATAVVPAGQVSEDLTDFPLLVVLPAGFGTVVAVTDGNGVSLDFNQRASGAVVVKCRLLAAADNIIQIQTA
jgi:hypothetical protein